MADQNQESRIDYYCHRCRVQFHSLAPVAACAECGEGFIEQIPRPASFPIPPNVIPPPGFGGMIFNHVHPSTSDQNQRSPPQNNGDQNQAHGHGPPPPAAQARPPLDQFVGRIVDMITGGAGIAGVARDDGSAQPQQPAGDNQNHGGGNAGQQPGQGDRQDQNGAQRNQNQQQGARSMNHLPAEFVHRLAQQLTPNIRVHLGTGAPPNGEGADGDGGGDQGADAGDRRPRHEVYIQIDGQGGQLQIGQELLNIFGFANEDAAALRNRISDADIERLPMTTVPAGVDRQCTTCMDNLKEGVEVGKLNCGHMFHRECIVPWLQGHVTCPVCRNVIDPTAWVLQKMQENDVDLD